jgi:hypothetical protein
MGVLFANTHPFEKLSDTSELGVILVKPFLPVEQVTLEVPLAFILPASFLKLPEHMLSKQLVSQVSFLSLLNSLFKELTPFTQVPGSSFTLDHFNTFSIKLVLNSEIL